MMSRSIRVVYTLLLVAAKMSIAGPAACLPIGAGVTRFVCVNCTATGRLSSHGLFLHRAGVRRHISASKACFAADLGFMSRLGPATSWRGRGVQLVPRRTYVTNLQIHH